MKTEWILVADAAEARILERRSRRAVPAELAAFCHPEAHLREQDLVSDKRGRSFDSRGEGRHAMEPRTTQQRHEAMRFAKRLADELERAASQFDTLTIIASPELLGLLRKELHTTVRQRLTREIAKNLAKASPDEIHRLLTAEQE